MNMKCLHKNVPACGLHMETPVYITSTLCKKLKYFLKNKKYITTENKQTNKTNETNHKMVTAKITPEEREQVIMKMKAILDECNHNKNLIDNIPLKIEKIAELFELMLSDLGKFFLAQKNCA